MRKEYEIRLCQMFGRNLAKIRKEKGWSQEKLALETGLARSYIGDVERGIRNIALINICRISDTLEIDTTTLMSFRGRTFIPTDSES